MGCEYEEIVITMFYIVTIIFMKLSKLFHVLGALAWTIGVLALFAAWYVSGNGGTVLGMDEAHLFNDAIVLILVAIWLQLATLHHMVLEKRGEIL